MLSGGSEDPEHGAAVQVDCGASDGELLTSRSDKAAFTDLYCAVFSPVRRYLQRMIGLTDADDLTADVFVTAWSRWAAAPPGFDRRRAWVFGIAHFKVREAIRARQRSRGLMQRVMARRLEFVADDPSETIAAMERTRQLLELLPSAERDAIALTVLGGLRGTEAAAVLDCSVSAVTSRVSRARARLKEILEANLGVNSGIRR